MANLLAKTTLKESLILGVLYTLTQHVKEPLNLLENDFHLSLIAASVASVKAAKDNEYNLERLTRKLDAVLMFTLNEWEDLSKLDFDTQYCNEVYEYTCRVVRELLDTLGKTIDTYEYLPALFSKLS